MQVTKEGSVRVDLVGGTLDLDPIHLILPDVVTLNLATSLKAVVQLKKIDFSGVKIISKDYGTENSFQSSDFTTENIFQNDFFGPLKFVVQILSFFKVDSHLEVTLSSKAPPGSGLGGSSAMGMTLFHALEDYCSQSYGIEERVRIVKNIEARILHSGPTGYQDYYPAAHGGCLALRPNVCGVEVEQLFEADLMRELESHCTLIFSGKTRLSGINNWEVFKGFFDTKEVNQGLTEISEVAFSAYNLLKQKNIKAFMGKVIEEGLVREKLFSKILTPEMKNFKAQLKKIDSLSGIKVCGAGGGGCFLAIHDPALKTNVQKLIKDLDMTELAFTVETPLKESHA